jgi:TPP-dependent pyruvate/acetoin dehydrogenase alpha subunit
MKTKDPLPRYQNQLMEMGILSQSDVDQIEEEITIEIQEAIATIEDLPKGGGRSGPRESLAVDGI